MDRQSGWRINLIPPRTLGVSALKTQPFSRNKTECLASSSFGVVYSMSPRTGSVWTRDTEVHKAGLCVQWNCDLGILTCIIDLLEVLRLKLTNILMAEVLHIETQNCILWQPFIKAVTAPASPTLEWGLTGSDCATVPDPWTHWKKLDCALLWSESRIAV